MPLLDDELPLLGLFDDLRRQADLPLGVDEYLQMLQALQAGFGVDAQGEAHAGALRRLCYILWTNSLQEQKRLDYYFDLMLEQRRLAAEKERAAPEAPAQPSLPSAEIQPVAAALIPQPVPAPAPPPGAGETLAAALNAPARETLHYVASSAARPDLALDETQLARSMQAAAARQFVFTGEYLPITQRQMKQTWRHLRSLARLGRRVELNVKATVDKIARDGLLIEPVLEPRRSNRIALLLLVDRLGSMVPFHIQTERLVESAQKGGRLAQAGVYYFNNIPRDKLYLAPTLVKAQPLEEILNRLPVERTVALIFSDAGAARGRVVPPRVELTAAFLRRLKAAVRRVAWINPMPRGRWQGTTAEEIARLAPMFQFTRLELDRAIDLLRGRGAQPAGER